MHASNICLQKVNHCETKEEPIMVEILIIIGIILFVLLAYLGFGYFALVAATVLGLTAWKESGIADMQTFQTASLSLVAILVIFGIPILRRLLVSSIVMKLMKKALPTISDTEDAALKAGTVWWDGDVFSGVPKWKKLLKYKIPALTKEEQSFVDNETEELCKMLDEEEIVKEGDLSPKVWKYIKENKFLGMIIPKEHGGRGFGAYAHSAVVTKIATRSSTAAVSVMVPNSLGPAELLLHYGTKEQQDHYLPRLATGEEIPCFALTEPHAGSDAANGRSYGVVTKGKHNGKEVIGIKLNFNKRYITLAPIATVIGLAFKLYDPEKLLGNKEDIGITCALLPRDTKGMKIGDRHDPMGVPFMNGPIFGEDVFIPMDYVIGGEKYVGQGWRMLMDCLSVGRSISLPSLSVGAAQLAVRTSIAYTSVREQFGLPISRFEGIRERMARMIGFSYAATATVRNTTGAIDRGEKPAVASGISKAYLTESMRIALNDGMDIQAGAAICRGDRNIYSRIYTSIPIGITVEGANILTRSLIVFGQGAMRCHPFLLKEVNAIMAKDLKAFDRAFFGHINHVVRNGVRALVHGLTGGIFACVPCGRHRKNYRKVTRLSAAFAYAADLALLTLGGALKRKEYLSGRFADALAWMYIASMSLKKAHDEERKEDDAIVDWIIDHAMYEAQEALFGVIQNLPNRPAAWKIRFVCFPLGRIFKKPSDTLVDKVMDSCLNPKTGLYEHLTPNLFVPEENVPGLGKLDATFKKVLEAAPTRAKLMKLVRANKVKKDITENMAKEALEQGLLTQNEYDILKEIESMKDDVVQVNHFTPKSYKERK